MNKISLPSTAKDYRRSGEAVGELIQRHAAVALLVCVTAGCASVPRGDDHLDATLKQFSTKPDVAGLYIYCNEWMGLGAKSNVAVDGEPLGQLGSRTYLHTDVPPGRHSVTATMENTDSLEFDAEPSRNYYVWHEKKAGWFYPRVQLHLISDTEAQDALQSTRLAAPTYREEDMEQVKATAVWSSVLGTLLGNAVGALVHGLGAIGISTFVH